MQTGIKKKRPSPLIILWLLSLLRFLFKFRFTVGFHIACSRLSGSGEDAKETGTRKVGGAGKRKKEKGREREPVIIYFPTLFRPLLARLR